MLDYKTKNILVVGTARDCDNGIEPSILVLQQALASFKKVHWLVVESDSKDGTLTKLDELKTSITNFNFISLGSLLSEHPLRSDRLAFCRNAYLDEIRNNQLYANVDFVLMADLDDVNNLVTQEGIASCFTRDDWDVCTANQLGNYYDIWALRHKVWSPNDFWEHFNFFGDYNISPDLARIYAILSRTITIPKDAPWIEVDSAFGGLAIYRRATLDKVKYVGLTEDGAEICEHVPLHQQIKAQGFRIFINPALINCDVINNRRFAFGIFVVLNRFEVWTLRIRAKMKIRTRFKALVNKIITHIRYIANHRKEYLLYRLQPLQDILWHLRYLSTTADDFIIITGANSTHYQRLCQLLISIEKHEPNLKVIVYDLGFSQMQKEHFSKVFSYLQLRVFDYQNYPSYVNMNTNAGEYAWKAIIVDTVLNEFKSTVLWMDAGNFVNEPLSLIKKIVKKGGLYIPNSVDFTYLMTHPETLKFLNPSAKELPKPQLLAACVGISYENKTARNLSKQWHKCSLIKECIAPDGSNRGNHRQDQAVFSILAYQSGLTKNMPVRFYGFSMHKKEIEEKSWEEFVSILDRMR